MTKHEIPSDYKYALGALVIETARMEASLTNLIGAVTGMNLLHQIIVVHHQQAASKIDSLRALCQLSFGDNNPNYAQLERTLNAAKAIADYRNTLVHGYWRVSDDGETHTVRWQARGTLTRSIAPVDIEELRQKTLEAIDTRGTLDTIALALREYAKVLSQSDTDETGE